MEQNHNVLQVSIFKTKAFKNIRFAGNCIIIFLTLVITGFSSHHPVTIIQFKHLVGNKELKLFDETYTNSFGEPFVVNRFKYYISHISFIGAGKKITYLPDNYYLISEDDSLSKRIELPATGITSVSFDIGVDSIRNVSGVQTGSLDPMNGMFWTWNSGYVFAKLEGQSDASTAPVHSFSWHVGGFKRQENARRRVLLTVHKIDTIGNQTIVINADILKWFNGVHDLTIATSPVCHQPGQLAMQIADNYSTMFSVEP